LRTRVQGGEKKKSGDRRMVGKRSNTKRLRGRAQKKKTRGVQPSGQLESKLKGPAPSGQSGVEWFGKRKKKGGKEKRPTKQASSDSDSKRLRLT